MNNDPFSEILQFTHAQSVVSGGFSAGGAWSIRFPAPDKIKFFALIKGHCWLYFEDAASAIDIDEGDVILLAAPRSFVLAGDLAALPLDAMSIFGGGTRYMAKIGDSEECIQIGGHIQLDPVNGGLLSTVLPPLIHVRAAAPQVPGAQIASAQLAQLMFVQILRVHLSSAGTVKAGWLRALADPRIAPILRLIHDDPGHAWRLEELAAAAAMSRTTFALHFKAAAGVAPLTYLTEWRMRLAERALREDDMPVAVLARSLGYTSESAFSNAFKRITGSAPKRYRNAARAMRPLAENIAQPESTARI